MKSIGIITIIGNNNYGNRLQNYATQSILKKLNFEKVETIKNEDILNKRRKIIGYKLRKVINIYFKMKNKNPRKKYFSEFNRNICFSKCTFDYYKVNRFKYDYYIVGSDQIWNPYYRLSGFDLADFIESENKIAFSASFGVSALPVSVDKKNLIFNLKKFKKISVREDVAKEIINNLIDEKNVEVLVDPTMLLTSSEWDKVVKEPKQFNNLNNKKYVLNYFLGNLSDERKNKIEEFAKQNNCIVINILDKDDPFYKTGPSEFLYLEKNAFLICTDSFHSCVFAILYNRPFVIFDREEEGVASMESRIETLLSKFKIENRKFETKITNENLNHDYSKAYSILEEERKKSFKFLRDALDINDSETLGRNL